MRYTVVILLCFIGYSCTDSNDQLLLKTVADSGITFSNDLNYTQELNPYTYRNYYNGAGVGIGDFDNDGLEDIYFTGNQVNNELYRNLGNLQFERVDNELISCAGSWSTGVSIIDINADGLMDIYVCKAGPPGGERRANELFINKGNWQFEEQASDYGLDIKGFSIHASFFDFDKDGDLDCYLLNNSLRSVGSYDLREGQREESTFDGNKLLVNADGLFVDRSDELGIYTSNIGFGLGVITTDINGDSWPDIYVSNDFFERDYYYINQAGVGFKEQGEKYFSSFSLGSMGVDAADYDQDGDIDIVVAEMAPATLERQKTKLTYDSWDKYSRAIKMGYYHQFPRNMVHEQEDGFFADVSRMYGMSTTEWSWAPLIFDVDNDGLMDVFISNGVGKDLLDRDYLNYMADDQKVKELIRNEDGQSLKRLIDIMPSQKVQNALYRQKVGKQFMDVSTTGVNHGASFSNGSAIADLDNDGDMDMIISNIDDRAFVLRNQSKSNFVKLKLHYVAPNQSAVGSKVWLFTNTKAFNQSVNPYRGFQSSISNNLIFGVGDIDDIDSIKVQWPNGQYNVYEDISVNTTEILKYYTVNEAVRNQEYYEPTIALTPIDSISYEYPQRLFNEFNREKLLTQMLPINHPILDIGSNYIYGGAKESELTLIRTIEADEISRLSGMMRSHVTIVHRFDSDGDEDLDLYVGVGSRQYSVYSPELHDQLYENLGDDNYELVSGAFSFDRGIVTADVDHIDFDNDGDADIIIAEAISSDNYGSETSLLVYENLGSNKFDLFAEHKVYGQLRDINVEDINGDDKGEIVITGEWMGIEAYHLIDGRFFPLNFDGLSNTTGLWRDIEIVDIDKDGDLDIVGANQGLNSHYSTNTVLFVSDFDNNGRGEQIVSMKDGDQYYPVLDFDEMVMQLPSIRKTISNYEAYANADMIQIFGPNVFETALKYELNELRSGVFINSEEGYTFKAFPQSVQKSSMHCVEIADINRDNVADVLIGGNHYLYKPQFGRDDASLGHLLIGGIDSLGYKIKDERSLGLRGEMRLIQKENENDFWIGIYGNDLVKYNISYED